MSSVAGSLTANVDSDSGREEATHSPSTKLVERSRSGLTRLSLVARSPKDVLSEVEGERDMARDRRTFEVKEREERNVVDREK